MHRIITFSFLMSLGSIVNAQETVVQEDVDKYVWLESTDVNDVKVTDWVKEQNNKTLEALSKMPEYSSIFTIAETYKSDNTKIPYPASRVNKDNKEYLYNFWQDKEYVRGLWRRTTLEEYSKQSPSWETLINFDELSKNENVEWVYQGATCLNNSDKCLMSMSIGGKDAKYIREFDVDKKEFVKDGFYLPEAYQYAYWVDEDTILVSSAATAETNSHYPKKIQLWKRGTQFKDANVVFDGETTDTSVVGSVFPNPEGSHTMFVRWYYGSKGYNSTTYFYEKDKSIKIPKPESASVKAIFKNQLVIKLEEDWTTESVTYKTGSLVAIDVNQLLTNGKLKTSKIFEPGERVSIKDVYASKGYLVVNLMDNLKAKLLLYCYDQSSGKWTSTQVNLPEDGTIGIQSADSSVDKIFVSYQSYLIPTTLYLLSEKNGYVPEKIKALSGTLYPDLSTSLELVQKEAISKDGTKIPYTVISPKGIKLDGQNPTLLYGYGGFNISMEPFYLGYIADVWLKKGGVYVMSNIRGGGEFGPAWHQAGIKENKQNVFDDFIAVAEALVSDGITSSKKLGIMGGSNGGLLVGAVLTQRPDLFNAVVCQVPLLDMLKYSKLGVGSSWISEYGDPDDPTYREIILKYSPYQNVKEDVKYPSTLFVTSNDDRVHRGHARKMAAKMVDLGNNAYYFEGQEGGHSASATIKQEAERNALEYSFLIKQLMN